MPSARIASFGSIAVTVPPRPREHQSQMTDARANIADRPAWLRADPVQQIVDHLFAVVRAFQAGMREASIIPICFHNRSLDH